MPVQIGLRDVLAGSVNALVLAHISTSVLVYPYSLPSFDEADYFGYSPAACVVYSSNQDPSGYLFITYQVTFPSYEQDPQNIDGIWLDARYQEQVRLLAIIQTPLTGFAPVMPGGTTYYLQVQTYQGA